MSTPNTQPETSAGAASTEGVLVIEDKIKISHEAIIDFSSPIITDEDVVCSQTDRDGFKAFVEDQGESDLGKTIRLIDYIVAKEIYESSQADLVNEPRFHGVTIQETATLVVMRIRNETFTKLKTSEAAWELFLMALRQDGIACDYKNETEALIRTLGGTVPMDVWDRIWRQFMRAWRADVFRASSAMANDLVNFIDSKNSGEKRFQAILVSLPDWIKEWMEKTLKK